MVASNLHSGSGDDEKPLEPLTVQQILRITFLYQQLSLTLCDDAEFDRIEKHLDEMLADPETRTVAMLALLGMGVFDEKTFKLYKELQG